MGVYRLSHWGMESDVNESCAILDTFPSTTRSRSNINHGVRSVICATR
jgi:hypothetical protein